MGLLHDFDYERWPNAPDHPLQGAKILAETGYPPDVIYAIKSHADYLTDCPRVSRLDKTTDATNITYHAVATNGAKPTVGYLVQARLGEGSSCSAPSVIPPT